MLVLSALERLVQFLLHLCPGSLQLIDLVVLLLRQEDQILILSSELVDRSIVTLATSLFEPDDFHM